jgi:aldehyde:ferredoxin oxidoreductase
LDSYSGKCLVIDLTTRRAETRGLPESLLRSYLGGAGLGTRLLAEWVAPGTAPLSPGNVVVFASSALAGTVAPCSSNHATVTKSPLTGFLSDSVSSGHWSLSLKRAGYDALIVTGAAESPAYLLVDDEIVHFNTAGHLWGRNSAETAEEIRRYVGDERVRVAAIGPAGERLIRYACIDDGYPLSHRGGAGAVMGSKKLKAIAVRGTKAVSVHDLCSLEEASLALHARVRTAPASKHRQSAILDCLLAINRLGALPARNFRKSSIEGTERLGEEKTDGYRLVKTLACPSCPVACRHLLQVIEGPYSGAAATLDYQTLAALGPLCGIDDMPAILKAAELCQRYGMDTVSTGGSIAWAMEGFESGLFTKEDTRGTDLSFGRSDALIEMVKQIGERQGIGDLLAEGTRRASVKLGRGSEQWVMHSKGLELSGCDPRTAQDQALWSAVGLQTESHDCPPCRGSAADPPGNAGSRNKAREDRAALFASLMICDQMSDCFQDFLPEAANLYRSATGIEISPAELERTGERISTLKKSFNIREGWKRTDDWLPARLLEDAASHEKARSGALSETKLKAMLDEYYEARGWTVEGLIPQSKLKALGLDNQPAMVTEE